MITSPLLKMFTILAILLSPFYLVASNQQLTENAKYQVNGHAELNKVITELADKLFIYNKLSGSEEEIAITSFVDLHQFEKTTHFGRTISEAFFDELFTRGFNVSDFRGQETLSINENGEYFLTRDIKLLNKDIVSGYILVGTYSLFEDKVYINVRILDNLSGKVVASARSNYITNDCNVVGNCKKPRVINIVKHGEKPKPKEVYAKVDNSSIHHHLVQKKLIQKKILLFKQKPTIHL